MTYEMSPPRDSGFHFRPMKLEDIPEVVAIDEQSFPSPWSQTTYRKELTGNPAASLYVAATRSAGNRASKIIGYIGFWFLVDEAHISTFAVHPEYRRRGFGRRILYCAFEQARRRGAMMVTLEVRESNHAAIELYQSTGFYIRSRKLGYYRDTEEDALVMQNDKLEIDQLEERKYIREC